MRIFNKLEAEEEIVRLSKIFKNISFERLTELLGLSAEFNLEEMVAQLISKDKIHASIDQVARVIVFDSTPMNRSSYIADLLEKMSVI